MTNIELVLNMLAEITTTELSQKEKPVTHLKKIKKLRNVAGNLPVKQEKDTKKKWVEKLYPQQMQMIKNY